MDTTTTASAATNAETPIQPSQAQQAVAKAPAKATTGSNLGSPVQDIIAIRAEHDVWFAGSYARSNADLYNLLAKCLDAFQRMRGKKHLMAAFAVECKQAGYNFHKSTDLLGRIVRYVFGANRKRTSAYARALAVAVAEDINFEPAKLHLWIAAKGGIEEIRNNGKKGPTAKQRQADNVAVATSAIASVVPFSVIEGAKIDTTESPTDFVVAIARTIASGAIEVIGFVTDADVVDSALAAYGKKVTIKGDADARTDAADSKIEALAAATA